MRMRSALVLAMLALSTAGCAIAGTGVTGPGVGVGAADQPMVFPECQTAELAFAGETTLGAIGLGDFAGGPDANKVGMVWVTAGPVSMGVPAPMPAGGGKGADVPAARMVCVQWPDGSGMAGNIPDEWVLPENVSTTIGSEEETSGGVPVGMLVLVGGATVLVGVSVLAFRREDA